MSLLVVLNFLFLALLFVFNLSANQDAKKFINSSSKLHSKFETYANHVTAAFDNIQTSVDTLDYLLDEDLSIADSAIREQAELMSILKNHTEIPIFDSELLTDAKKFLHENKEIENWRYFGIAATVIFNLFSMILTIVSVWTKSSNLVITSVCIILMGILICHVSVIFLQNYLIRSADICNLSHEQVFSMASMFTRSSVSVEAIDFYKKCGSNDLVEFKKFTEFVVEKSNWFRRTRHFLITEDQKDMMTRVIENLMSANYQFTEAQHIGKCYEMKQEFLKATEIVCEKQILKWILEVVILFVVVLMCWVIVICQTSRCLEKSNSKRGESVNASNEFRELEATRKTYSTNVSVSIANFMSISNLEKKFFNLKHFYSLKLHH